MKLSWLFVLVMGTSSMSILGEASTAPHPITLDSLLREMIDRDRLARVPDPPYTCKQFSSYDRASIAPGLPGWFANHDFSNYLRTEQKDGRTEYAMMDADGPGSIACFFKATTDPAAVVRIYLDGSSTPTISENLRYLLGGEKETEQEAHFNEPRVPPYPPDPGFLGGYGTIRPPLAGVQSLGCTLFLPIPFAKHCKVTYDRPGKCYYRIDFRSYPPSTAVRTFTLQELRDDAALIDQVGKALLNPLEVVKASVSRNVPAQAQELAPGASLRTTITGPAAVRFLKVKIDSKNPAQSLRSTVLSIVCDGAQTVWSPVGDFFNSGIGIHSQHNWVTSVEPDGTLCSYWVMPFAKDCTIKLTNTGAESVGVTLGDIGTSKWQWDYRSMYFHAQWHQQYPIRTVAGNGTMDWNYIEISGKGVYVGDTLVIHNGSGRWWGEGDEKIYVNGETFPSHFGTGTEDYYGYSRGGGDSAFFEAPFMSHSQVEGDKRPGYSAITRVRGLDAIPFSTSLKFDMEIWHWDATEMEYAVNVCWYGRPGATSNIQPDAAESARPVLGTR